jgi:TPR repeat protein
MLGTIFFDGKAVTLCLKTSFKWFLKASTNGHYGAQLKLVEMYGKGLGVCKNTTSAHFWQRKAVENTNIDDRFKEEFIKVYEILLEKAMLGKPNDQFALGLYLEEKGEKHWIKASRWYKLAADQGHLQSQIKMALAFMYGYSHSNKESNYEMSIKYVEMSASQGNVDSQIVMAECYMKGVMVGKCEFTAFYWFEKAAINNCANAQFMLGKMLSEGVGAEKDPQKSNEWYKRATLNHYDEKKDKFSPLYEGRDSDNGDNEQDLTLSKKDKDIQNEECTNCGKTSKLLSCARCQIQKYCSKACQKQHWKAIGGHKKFCISKGERNKVLSSNVFSTRADVGVITNCCSICIEAIIKGPISDVVVLQSCSHQFHVKCFQLLMESESNERCPVCRVDIDIVKVFEKNTERILRKSFLNLSAIFFSFFFLTI